MNPNDNRQNGIFFFANPQMVPASSIHKKSFPADFQPFHTPGSLRTTYQNGFSYTVGIHTAYHANHLTNTILDLLQNYLQDLWNGRYDIVNLNSEKSAEEVSRSLLKQYINQFAYTTGIDLMLLDNLSHQKYEGAKCSGTLLFSETNPSSFKAKVSSSTPICLETNELRQIRKLMAGAGGSSLYFVRDEENDDQFVFSGYTDQSTTQDWKADITGSGKITVSLSNVNLFQIVDRIPCLIEDRLNGQLQEIYHLFSINDPFKQNQLQALLKEIEAQGHGAAVLFLNLKQGTAALERMNTLCELKRGFSVSNNVIMPALAAMDGAIAVNTETCEIAYFGLIVDGIARQPGNTARGARHNSLHTFCCDFRLRYCNEPVAAIVFSEDGGSTIYS